MTELTLERLAALERRARESICDRDHPLCVEHCVKQKDLADEFNPTLVLALLAAARRDADVRTLDGQGSWEMVRLPDGWVTLGSDSINISGARSATPDEARAKAAAWVREQGIESGKGGDRG